MYVHGLKKQFPGSIWIKKFIENNNIYSFFEIKLSASAQNTVDPGGRHTDLQGLSSAVLQDSVLAGHKVDVADAKLLGERTPLEGSGG